MDILTDLPRVIAAVGALGTAAFGLVDATKVFWGGVNRIGFSKISSRVASLLPEGQGTTDSLPAAQVIKTLRGNWFNGTDLGSQKAIAKSLIRLHLNADNAPTVARAANVDAARLTAVVTKQAEGVPLLPQESDFYSRFDLIVTAMLDESYQIADQDYRNGTRGLAVVFSVELSLGGWIILHHSGLHSGIGLWGATVIGLIATPIAPIAKDLSSALATAVNTLQAVKR
jgi:hypothetical protein